MDNNKGTILVIKGESLYNVLRIAADYMVDSFREKGFCVTVLDLTLEEHRNNINDILFMETYVLIFSFQALLFEFCITDTNTSILSVLESTPVVGHIVDHPIYHSNKLKVLHGENMYIGCIDRTHVKYIEKYYKGVKNPVFLPHAGFSPKNKKEFKSRTIDLFFPCTYAEPEELMENIQNYPDVYKNIALHIVDQYRIDPMTILEDELEIYLKSIGFVYDANDFLLLMSVMKVVDQYVRAYLRKQSIEYLISSGIHVVVTGDSWNKFESDYKENIKVIGENGLDFLEVLEIMADSKIVLNNAPTYQYGTHERIYTSMLCGAVCLTNDFISGQEEFQDGENIMLFSNQNMESSITRIKELLENNDRAEEIAKKGYQIAKKVHTWNNNVEKILDLLGIQ